MDGISSTVHPDGIRNTVRPRLRAHRPPPGVLDDKQSRPVSEVSWEVLLLRLGIPQTLHLASAWRCRRGRPPTPCPSSAWPCSPRRLSSPSRLLAAEPVQSSRIRCQGRLPCRRRSGPGAEGGRAPAGRCNDWASICRGSRVSTDPGLPSSVEQPFVLSSANITPARFVSFSELLPVSNSSMRWVQKDHEMARTMTV